jgi:hypothetical protein
LYFLLTSKCSLKLKHVKKGDMFFNLRLSEMVATAHLSFSVLSRRLKLTIYKTINFTCRLCKCETSSVNLTKGRILRVCENKVLKTFEPGRDETTSDRNKISGSHGGEYEDNFLGYGAASP